MICLFVSQYLVQVLRQYLVQDCCFSPIWKYFWVCLKWKMRFSERKLHVLPFCVGERQTYKKKNKGKLQKKMPRKAFWEWWGKWIINFSRMAFLLEKLQNTICFWKAKEGQLRQQYLFWENCAFLFLYKTLNTTKIGVSAGTGENPKPLL